MKRRLPIISLLLLCLLGAAGFAVLNYYNTARKLSYHMYDPLPIIHKVHAGSDTNYEQTRADKSDPINNAHLSDNKNKIDHQQPFTILLIGVDRRPHDHGRSDVLMVAAVNPQQHCTVMMNIPRDTLTTIAGKGMEDKINHAFAYGGAAMTIATVEQFLGVPINYYIKADMNGFREIVDLIGGVDVNNAYEFNFEGFSFAEGELHLNGKEALAYVRMRYEDPQGDHGRNERQRSVMKAILRHILNITSITRFNKIADALGNHVKTNISFDEWKMMTFRYRDAFDTIDTEKVRGSGKIITGIYYYIVTNEERERIRGLLQDYLAM